MYHKVWGVQPPTMTRPQTSPQSRNYTRVPFRVPPPLDGVVGDRLSWQMGRGPALNFHPPLQKKTQTHRETNLSRRTKHGLPHRRRETHKHGDTATQTQRHRDTETNANTDTNTATGTGTDTHPHTLPLVHRICMGSPFLVLMLFFHC